MSEPNEEQKTKKFVRRAGAKITKRKLAKAQILMEMGDIEAYETVKRITMASNVTQTQTTQTPNAKVKKNNQLETLYCQINAEKKRTQKLLIKDAKPSVVPLQAILPKVGKKAAKKIRQTQRKQTQYYSMQQRTVTEQILHVISTITPDMLQNQIPSTSMTSLGQNMLQQPQPNTTIMAPGQSIVQYSEPPMINTGQITMQYPGPPIMNPGQNTMMYHGQDPTMMAPGQSMQYQESVPAIMNPGQGTFQYLGADPAVITPGQSMQYPGPFTTVTSDQSGMQYPGPVPAIMPSKQNALQPQEPQEMQSGLQNTKPLGPRKRRGRRGGKNKPGKHKNRVKPPIDYNVVNFKKIPSPFQAPHQNEPEDLTDDLAPNTAGQSVQQAGSQPGAVTSENKLNFKFQRTVPKNPDWSEYQNKFKRIGGGSPDDEAGADKEVKQEPNADQTINTGAANANPRTENTATAGQSQQAAKAAATAKSKVVIQKVEILKPAGKSTEIPLKPIEVRCKNFPNTLKPIQVHCAESPNNANFQPDPNMYSFPTTSDTSAPRGIPKTFLQEKRNPEPPPQTQTRKSQQHPGARRPFPPFQGFTNYPAGIPRSFIQQEAAEAQLPPPENPQAPIVNHPPEPDYNSQPATYVDLPSWILASQAPQPQPVLVYEGLHDPRGAPASNPEPPDRAYSPSDVYETKGRGEEEIHDGSESPDILQSGQKRLSAFKRLGPLTQPKKPKLTINLTLNKEQAVREVVDETDDSYRFIPVHLRKDILQSTDETVVKYLPFWPWKRNIMLRKTASARFSKSVMILEQEQMESAYDKDTVFIHISVKGYPKTWSKEDVLDAILDCVKGKSFIPCFIEFTQKECKFLVIRCRAALLAIHKVGFCIRKHDVELTVSISLTDMSLNQIDLIPRLVLRKRLMNQYDGEKALELQEFLTEKDVSHFVYFPLNRLTNQMELVQLQSAVSWEYLTELNLSRNRLTSIDGFDLNQTTPRLKILDLSHNYLDKLTILLRLRDLPIQSLKLEGNPLCHDYIDSAHYIKVVKMIFSGIKELDGVRITLKGDFPPPKRNYCPEGAVPVVEKFLEVFFPLLEASYDDRTAIEDLYDKDAVLTITFRYKLRYGTSYRYFRSLFLRARSLEENDMESVKGAATISSLINKWPAIEHDRYTITVDVMHHDDYTTILRVGGVLKLTADSLAEDEHLLTFTRNIVLHTRTGAEYRIHHEMLYWDVPSEEAARTAFNVTTVRPKQLSVKLESPPDADLKAKLVDIFVNLADIDKKRGARCLELKNWDLRSALEYYVSLLKLDDLSVLSPKHTIPVPLAS